MHPLFFIGVALAVVGLVASGDKKKPADNTQTGGVAPDTPEATPIEAEVICEDDPGKEEKKQELLGMLPANVPPEFEGIDPEDVKRLYAKNPQAVNDPMADIATATSRFCRENGETGKANSWWKYAEYLRRGTNDK